VKEETKNQEKANLGKFREKETLFELKQKKGLKSIPLEKEKAMAKMIDDLDNQYIYNNFKRTKKEI